ncbi:MAG: MotA/TolQ/ExbB proton channel family protein [Candidatus Omnitrophica bacterium]|nr:MotA/TolQ/ExbB proton channel family protein [Candidatus Omnitrophota bacterium]
MIVKGGPLMVPILIGSVFGVALVIERALVLFRISAERSRECLHRVLEEVKAGRFVEAVAEARKSKQPVGAVLEAGLEQWGMPLEVVKEAMEEANQQQTQRLEHWLGGISTVITVAPMLGFLGTITGLIKAFMSWESAGAEVTVSVLASGIYEAMLTTAAGLFVAIPLLAAYNAFISRIKHTANFSAQAAHRLAMLYAREQSKEPTREAARLA